jgi:hypothetical protein
MTLLATHQQMHTLDFLVPRPRECRVPQTLGTAAYKMPEHAGMMLLGVLTALRNLKFDLARHHSMSDDALRELARLRLTSLSLPGLRLVRI